MKPQGPYFIDLFAGCGGLSLGLFEAGWQGLFAIEREQRAFDTLKHNLMDRGRHRFAWPHWLKRRAWTLEDLLRNRKARKRLTRLHGRVHLLAGGPPCQGFSSLGKRRADDPRNQLFRHYMTVVRIIKPKLVLIENVQGISHPFASQKGKSKSEDIETYADMISEELDRLGYKIWPKLLYASHYGVPQIRPRFLLIAALEEGLRPEPPNPFRILKKIRPAFLRGKGLSPYRRVTAGQAINDLHTPGRLEPWNEDPSFRQKHSFMQGRFGPQRSAYQRLMHGKLNGDLANSHRLVSHKPETVEKFQWFLDNIGPGKKIHPHERGPYFTKKAIIATLHHDKLAPTITTLPDDLLHYQEPRILTVRENARLQSFPDWFEFQGKYTTGGKERVKQCPRYTQVGNAVPPLLAESVGLALKKFLSVAFADPRKQRAHHEVDHAKRLHPQSA